MRRRGGSRHPPGRFRAVAATLRQVAGEAQQAADEPIDDVRLVVPAGWGPRHRTWLRHAARTAALAASRLVEAWDAALTRPDSLAATVPGRPALVLQWVPAAR